MPVPIRQLRSSRPCDRSVPAVRARAIPALGWLAAALLIGLPSISLPAHAAILDVPESYAAIGDALTAAAPGDTVRVAAGVYAENIVWPATQGLKLLSSDGPAVTTIDGRGKDQVIGIYTGVDTTTIVRGFTIYNGHAGGT